MTPQLLSKETQEVCQTRTRLRKSNRRSSLKKNHSQETIQSKSPQISIPTMVPLPDITHDLGNTSVAHLPIPQQPLPQQHQTTTQTDHQPPNQSHNATYTDRDGLLFYIDPNLPTPTVRYRLSEERHAHKRCVSNLYFILTYLLLRLWLEAILTQSPSLLALCGMGTLGLGWHARQRKRREEEEWRERMEELTRLAGVGRERVRFGGEEEEREMEGGRGQRRQQRRGVSDGERRKWRRYEYRGQHQHYGSTNNRNNEGQWLLSSYWCNAQQYGSTEQRNNNSNSTSNGNPNNNSISNSTNNASTSSTTNTSENDIDASGDFVDVEADSSDAAICSICLSDYEEGDRVVVLPCSHKYHDECVTPWTIHHSTCPLCNYRLVDVDADAER